jgi:redox-sensitive bicupin YhaK (pirin superfamily)
MSAGTGVRHSEFNPSSDEPVHLLQIWIEPDIQGAQPGYEEKQFGPAEKQGQLRLIASPDGREGSVTIHQEAYLYASMLDGKDAVTHRLAPGRRAYVHVARGSVKVNGKPLEGGDGVRIEDEPTIELKDAREAEVLLFDLP